MKKFLAGVIVLTAAFLPITIVSGQTCTIQGSDTLLALSQKWADAYKAKQPAVTLQVAGGGASAAFAALAEKKLDIALVSRSIRYKEAEACVAAFGRRPLEYKVAVNALVVYVNTNNPVQVLNYDEIASIYSGQSKNWKEFDGGTDLAITVYAQTTNSIHGELFNDELLNGKGMASEVSVLAGSEMLKAIANDPKAVGYGALAQTDDVRPLSIKRVVSSKPVPPSETNITSRIYPISRFVYCYVNPAAKNEVKALLDWIRSDEGQQVAKAAGFYLLPAKWRNTP